MEPRPQNMVDVLTNRRADFNGGSGVEWVHATRIGIAESKDGGFRSSDLTTWQQQSAKLLTEHGTAPTDYAVGQHPDVVVDANGRAWLFYFTQQNGPDADPNVPGSARRSVLHVTELHLEGNTLTVNRNAPADIHLTPPPKNKKSDIAPAW